MKFSSIWSVALLTLGLAACSRTDFTDPAPAADNTRARAASVAAVSATATASFPETFEAGTKTAYTTGSVMLGSGSWTLDDALLGTSTSDAKNGAQSARVRNVGALTMNFDVPTGAGTVTVAHAAYGADASSQWQLMISTNGGSSFTAVGAAVTSSSTALQTATFTVNQTGNVRLRISKISGGTNRINIDNVDITQAGSTGGGSTGGTKFLFDGSHGETAGNADWVPDEDGSTVVRFPTPAQSGITATTSGSYWTGALSSWAVALVKLGNQVEALPSGAAITYGTGGTQDLSNYNVFVVDEPNTRFTTAEKTAILQFVQNGGGLFMISDHDVSDRNSDGWDSPAIWNDLMSNNTYQNNPFGFSIALTNISETSSNVKTGVNPILNGSQGVVSQLKFSNGATITTNTATAQGLIWRGSSSQTSTSNIMCASSTYGTGRVVVITDSSPADDGSGASGNTLYPGWTELASHSRLHLNASLWLAKQQ